MVTRRFLASLSAPCLLLRTRAVFTAAGETLTAGGCVVLEEGWTALLPHARPPEVALPPLARGAALPLAEARAPFKSNA